MYLYYGLAGMKIRLCKPYYITTLQISQMVVGVAVCLAGGYYISIGETLCSSVFVCDSVALVLCVLSRGSSGSGSGWLYPKQDACLLCMSE